MQPSNYRAINFDLDTLSWEHLLKKVPLYKNKDSEIYKINTICTGHAFCLLVAQSLLFENCPTSKSCISINAPSRAALNAELQVFSQDFMVIMVKFILFGYTL